MMRPGGIELTVMPCLPTSRERPLAQACTAALAEKAPLMPSGSDLPVMLMMRPHLAAIICSSRQCVSWRWRVKLSVMASCHSCSLASSLNGRLPPALLTRMATDPSPARAAAAIRAGAPSCSRSSTISTGLLRPAATTSAATSSSSWARRATSANRTPSRARPSATPRPMPMLAPVMSAVLPSILRSINSIPQQRSETADGLTDVLHGIGVGKANVAFAVDAKAGAGNSGHAGCFQHLVLQVLGAHAGAGDIREHVEGAAGIETADPRQLIEQRHDGTAALVEGRHHLMHLILRSFQGCDAGVLRRGIDAGVAVDAQAHHVVDERRRPNRKAEAPTGHGVGLGPAVEQDQPIADFGVAQKALVLAPAVEHRAINLVREHGNVPVLFEPDGQALHLCGRHRAAAGIVRAVENNQAGLGCDLRQHLLGGKGKLVLFTEADRHRLGAGVLDHRAIDGKSRVWIHDLDAGLSEHQDREEHGWLAARHDDDAVGVDLDAVPAPKIGGDGLTQRQNALRRRITMLTIAQRLDGSIDDVLRRFEIRLANAEVDDILALALQFGGACQNLECRFGPQPLQIRHELQHGARSLDSRWRVRPRREPPVDARYC